MSLGKNHLQRTFSKIDNFAWREKKERQENSKNEKKKKEERKKERKKERNTDTQKEQGQHR